MAESYHHAHQCLNVRLSKKGRIIKVIRCPSYLDRCVHRLAAIKRRF